MCGPAEADGDATWIGGGFGGEPAHPGDFDEPWQGERVGGKKGKKDIRQ